MQIHHRWPREVGIKSKSAFSLVELSVSILILVILIVGILTGIHLINKANLSRAKMITANSEIPVIKGLTVWLESAMPESFQSETIEDGSIISNWYSRGNVSYKESNANSTGSQATDPVYVSNLAKGLPAVKFDSGHYLVAPDALVNTIGSVSHDGNYTLLFVESGRNISAGGSYFLALEGGDVNSDTIGYDSPTIINFFGHKADISSATSGTRIHLFSSSGTGASNQKSYYLNGQAQTQLTLNNLDSIKLADLKFTVDDNSSSGHNDALITKFLKQNLRNKLTKVSGPARWLMGNWTPTTDPSSVIYIREAANFNAPVTVEDATYINKTLSEKWLVSSEVPNPCKGSPCGSNGTCVANGASHSCTCNPGYSGGTCSTSVCTSNPCLHGGGCNVSGAGLAVCTCSGGYDVTTNCASCPSGTVEVNNACITDPCLTYTCNGHGACSTNSGSGLASCACSLGYKSLYYRRLFFTKSITHIIDISCPIPRRKPVLLFFFFRL